MRLLDLPHGHHTVIDEDSWPLVRDLTLYRGKNGYVYYSVWANGKSTPRTLHSLLLHVAKGMHVDHIDGDPLNNQRANLREATPAQNGANRRSLNRNNRSGVRGVHLNRHGSWIAQITVARKNRYLGSFATREDAIDRRRAAERELFGEFAP